MTTKTGALARNPLLRGAKPDRGNLLSCSSSLVLLICNKSAEVVRSLAGFIVVLAALLVVPYSCSFGSSGTAGTPATGKTEQPKERSL